MSPLNFVYWLQGLLEIGNPKNLDESQIQTIKDHIALVLTKTTPEITWPTEPTPWPTSPAPYIPNDDNMWKKRPYSPYEVLCSSTPSSY